MVSKYDNMLATWYKDYTYDYTYKTGNTTVECAYCGHYLGDSNPVNYINGQTICAMCLSKMGTK